MIVTPKQFDNYIRPVGKLLTTDGVQYATVVENQTAVYKDLFSIDSDTQFPAMVGFLAYIYFNISFIVWSAGAADPVLTYKAEAKNKSLTDWTIISAEETYTVAIHSEGTAVGKRLEGFIKAATGINKAPLSVRLQFKSDGTDAADKISIRLKNDTVIRPIGMYDLAI